MVFLHDFRVMLLERKIQKFCCSRKCLDTFVSRLFHMR